MKTNSIKHNPHPSLFIHSQRNTGIPVQKSFSNYETQRRKLLSMYLTQKSSMDITTINFNAPNQQMKEQLLPRRVNSASSQPRLLKNSSIIGHPILFNDISSTTMGSFCNQCNLSKQIRDIVAADKETKRMHSLTLDQRYNPKRDHHDISLLQNTKNISSQVDFQAKGMRSKSASIVREDSNPKKSWHYLHRWGMYPKNTQPLQVKVQHQSTVDLRQQQFRQQAQACNKSHRESIINIVKVKHSPKNGMYLSNQTTTHQQQNTFKQTKSPPVLIQPQIRQNPVKRKDYLEVQKESLVRKFNKSMYHKKKMSMVQKYMQNDSQSSIKEHTTDQNSAVNIYSNGIISINNQMPLSRNNKQSSISNQIIQTSKGSYFRPLDTTCETDQKHHAGFQNTIVSDSNFLFSTAGGGIPFTQNTLQNNCSFNDTAHFNPSDVYIGSINQMSAGKFINRRQHGYSSNSKSSKRYELHTNTSEEVLEVFNNNQENTYQENTYHNQKARIQSLLYESRNIEKGGKIRNICQMMLAARQSKENLQQPAQPHQISSGPNVSTNIGIEGASGMESLKASTASFLLQTVDSHAQIATSHNDSQRIFEEETKMSLDIAKMMIQKKKQRFLSSHGVIAPAEDIKVKEYKPIIKQRTIHLRI